MARDSLEGEWPFTKAWSDSGRWNRMIYKVPPNPNNFTILSLNLSLNLQYTQTQARGKDTTCVSVIRNHQLTHNLPFFSLPILSLLTLPEFHGPALSSFSLALGTGGADHDCAVSVGISGPNTEFSSNTAKLGVFGSCREAWGWQLLFGFTAISKKNCVN